MMLDLERSAGDPVMGIDEAGRGPLAGPVFAAAVHLPISLAEELIKGGWSAVNDSKKLTEKKAELLVVDWYKDDQPLARVKSAIETSLNDDLPVSYDKVSFDAKVDLLLTHFVDMAVQGYGWIAA